MAYGKVSETFWHDEKIRRLSEHARYFMLYLMSCPHGNRLGLFVLDPLYAAADVGWDPDQVREVLQELADAERISWDQPNRVVFVRNFLRHNTLLNGSVVKGALNDLDSVPDTSLLEELGAVVRAAIDGEDGPCRPHYGELMEEIMRRIMPKTSKRPVLSGDPHNAGHNGAHDEGQTIQGRGVSKPTPDLPLKENHLESNDREWAAPDDQPDGLSQMVEEYPEAEEVLNGLRHPGGARSTASSLRQRFVFVDEVGAMPDKSVQGVGFAERRRLVAGALMELRDQGHGEWNTRLFAGFVRRVRSADERADTKATDRDSFAADLLEESA